MVGFDSYVKSNFGKVNFPFEQLSGVKVASRPTRLIWAIFVNFQRNHL